MPFSLPGLLNFDGSDIDATDGAQVTLAGITQITRTNRGNVYISARDAGTAVSLPNLTTVTVPNFYQFELLAYTGATIDLPSLTQVNGAIDAIADGPGSTVSLPGLTGILTNSTSGTAHLEASDGGRVLIPNVTGLGPR